MSDPKNLQEERNRLEREQAQSRGVTPQSSNPHSNPQMQSHCPSVDEMKSQGASQEHAELVHQTVGAGMPFATILLAIIQRLPQAATVLRELLSSFSFEGKRPQQPKV